MTTIVATTTIIIIMHPIGSEHCTFSLLRVLSSSSLHLLRPLFLLLSVVFLVSFNVEQSGNDNTYTRARNHTKTHGFSVLFLRLYSIMSSLLTIKYADFPHLFLSNRHNKVFSVTVQCSVIAEDDGVEYIHSDGEIFSPPLLEIVS